jgi:fatty acid desaturase
MESNEELRKKAEKRAEEIVGFYVHLAIYIMVNLLLIIIWWFNGGLSVFPWFIFPLFGWGIGIVAHFVGVYSTIHLVDKIAEREFEKLKNQKK